MRFDPVHAPEPTDLDRPLHERTVGSLGLYLVRHSVDDLSYEYVDGANRTTVIVNAVPAHVPQGGRRER
jgi:anti-sigma regulatory factor (Ser/Thr protein kinase)